MGMIEVLLLLLGLEVAAKDRRIGLILQDDLETDLDSTTEQAFDFASMVMSNNLLDTQPLSSDVVKLHPVIRNRTDLTDNYKLGWAICSMVNEGVMLITGVSQASSFNTIQSYCQALQIPYVLSTPSRPSFEQGYHYDMSVCPPFIDAVKKVVANLTTQNEKIFYVYDSDDGLWRLQQLYRYFHMDAFRVRDIEKAYSLLRRVDAKDRNPNVKVVNKTIVLDLSSEHAFRMVLNQIVDVGMNRENYRYVLAGPDATDLSLTSDFFSQFLYGGVSITAFGFVNNHSDTYRQWQHIWTQHQSDFPDLFPLKTRSAMMIDAVRAIHEALSRDNIPEPIKSPRQGSRTCDRDSPHKSPTGPAIMNALSKVYFEGLTGPVALRSGERTQYKLEVYNMNFKQPMRVVDTWSPADLTEEAFITSAPRRYITNETQRVTTIVEPPFVMRVEAVNNGNPHIGPNQGLEGYCIDLLEELSRLEPFDYHIYENPDYGEYNETNGTWTGMIGQLTRKEMDIAVAPLTITAERERVVDFSKPYMDTGISIMIKKPDKTKPGVFSFMEPLDTMVWLCIGVGFLAVSFVLYFVGRFSPYEWNVEEDANDRTATTVFSISNTLWFSLGALMQQGSDISPRSFSGRVIGSAWWFFTLIIISSYTANLAAFLTIEKLVVTIDSADDLVGHPTVKYGTKKTGSSWKFFEESTIDTYIRMKEEMLERANEVLFNDYKEGIKKVRESKHTYAFLIEEAMNTYYSQQEPCDTMMVGSTLDTKGYGVATYLNHPLTDNLNIAVLTLKEKGELIKLKQKWWFDKGQCGDQSVSKESTGTQNALSLSNVSGIFHILIGGLVLSMITSSLEYLIQRKLRIRNKSLKDAKNYTLPVPPPPPSRRACFSSNSDRPAGTGPGWDNGYSNGTGLPHERQNLMAGETDDTKDC